MRLNWKSLTRDEKIAVVRVGAAKKMSASQIAAEMDECTRNAIIGAANRYNIQLNGSIRPKTKEKVAPPKTGLKTRPLAPLKSVKAKQQKRPVSVAKEAAEPAANAPTDWLSLSSEEKAAYVRKMVDKNLSANEIAATLINGTRDGVRSCAKRNGIRLTGNTAEARVARAKTVRKEDERPKENLGWRAMTSAEKMECLKKGIAAGQSADIIAASVKGATDDAVRSFAKRHGLKLPRKVRASSLFVNILDIQSNQCRAPMWEEKPQHVRRDVSEWVFCGKPTKPGSSFCAECHGRIWQPPKYEQKVTRRQMYQGYAK